MLLLWNNLGVFIWIHHGECSYMAWAWIPAAAKAVNWVMLVKEATKIVKEARNFYESSKKNEKPQAELIKELADQVEALTKAIETFRRMISFGIVLSALAIAVAVISLILSFVHR